GPRILRGDRDFCFFQAEDGIRDWSVTGVQTCALPISTPSSSASTAFLTLRRGGASSMTSNPESGAVLPFADRLGVVSSMTSNPEVGRASCRGEVENSGGAV